MTMLPPEQALQLIRDNLDKKTLWVRIGIPKVVRFQQQMKMLQERLRQHLIQTIKRENLPPSRQLLNMTMMELHNELWTKDYPTLMVNLFYRIQRRFSNLEYLLKTLLGKKV